MNTLDTQPQTIEEISMEDATNVGGGLTLAKSTESTVVVEGEPIIKPTPYTSIAY